MVETLVDILGACLPAVVSVSANSHTHTPVPLRTGRPPALQRTFQLRNPANDASGVPPRHIAASHAKVLWLLS